MASGQKWIPPLPPGWEGRWDANQRAYFFIDHTTKRTSWEDPRFKPQKPQPSPQPRHTAYGHQGGGYSQTGTYVQPTSQSYGASSKVSFGETSDSLNKAQEEKEKKELIEKLSRIYSASKDVIQDIIDSGVTKESEVKEMLKSLGFKTGGSSAASPAHKAVKSTAKSPAKSPAKSTTPAKPTLSAQQKKQMKQRLLAEFKDKGESVISVALDVCNYNEEQTRDLLKFSDEEASRPSSSARAKSMSPSSGTTDSGRRSTSLEPQALGTTIEAVVFGDDAPSPSHRPQSKTKTTSRPNTAGKKTASPPKQAAKKTRAKHVTHTGHTERVVTSQPQRPRYQYSEYRSVANGPDPSLRHGPDKDLLVDKYETVYGPNPEYRRGPDPSYVNGPQGAVGPDPSLRSGAGHFASSHYPPPVMMTAF